jgi:hypothetical protein
MSCGVKSGAKSGVFWANGWTFAFRINFEGKHRFTDSEVYLFIKVYSDDFKYRDLHLNCHHALVFFSKNKLVHAAAMTNNVSTKKNVFNALVEKSGLKKKQEGNKVLFFVRP